MSSYLENVTRKLIRKLSTRLVTMTLVDVTWEVTVSVCALQLLLMQLPAIITVSMSSGEVKTFAVSATFSP